MQTKTLMALLFAAALVACTDTTTYPISHEACGPDDPVKELDASDCVPS